MMRIFKIKLYFMKNRATFPTYTCYLSMALVFLAITQSLVAQNEYYFPDRGVAWQDKSP